MIAPWLRGRRVALTVALAAVAWTGISAAAGWRTTGLRFTRVDVVASTVAKQATANDLVVVLPWYLGASFDRYYDGAAAWTPLPPLEETRLQRRDLVHRQMATPRPIEPVLRKARETLAAGDRVFVVRLISALPPGARPRELPPAPRAAVGWNSEAYSRAWAGQLDGFLRRHARVESVALPAPRAGRAFESPRLQRAEGRP